MNAPVQVDQYDFWRRRLKGEVIPIHDGEPQAGFYRNGPSAVAYWFDKDGKIRCRVDNQNVAEQDAMERWPFASKKPVSHEAYTARIEACQWPSESKAVSEDIEIARTDPNANTFEGLQKRIAKLRAAADALIHAGAATTQESSDAAADLTDRLSKLWTQSDNLRKVEKQPHLDAEREVDNKWRAVLAAALIYKNIKAVVTEPFLKALQREKDRAAAVARAAVEAARLAAEEAERKLAEVPTNAGNNELIQEAAQTAQEAVVAAEARVAQVEATKVTAGTRGRVTHLRNTDVLVIENYDLVLAHFATHANVVEAVSALAEAALKSGGTVPGATLKKEGNAA
jgi:hypothetical protein